MLKELVHHETLENIYYRFVNCHREGKSESSAYVWLWILLSILPRICPRGFWNFGKEGQKIERLKSANALSFYRSQNVLSHTKNLIAFSASSQTFVPAQKPILLNANYLFVWHKMFVTATIYKEIFGLAQKVWFSPKHFGTCKRSRNL